MKKSLLYILTLLLLLTTSCGQRTKEGLYKNVIQHSFSNPKLKDKFSIQIIGHSIVEGTAVITITTHDGQAIYSEKYSTNYLINYGYTGGYYNKTQKEKYIKQRVDEFFLEENFLNPAISPNAQFDEDYSEWDNWNDIKSDSTAIGFYYLIGEESGCRIAYSKKQQQILTYFCCC